MLIYIDKITNFVHVSLLSLASSIISTIWSYNVTLYPSYLPVSLRWRLHFEFVTCRSPLPLVEQPQTDQDCATWQGPPELNVETMVWDLPIRVFATNPIHAATVSLLKLENSLNV